MDLSRFSIDAALFSGADASNAYRSVFYERLLSGLFEKDESLFAKTDIQKEREYIFAFPALYWLTRTARPSERSKVLYLCCDEAAASAAYAGANRMAEGNVLVKTALLDAGNASSEEVRNANLLFSTAKTFHDLLPSGGFMPRDFGFVIADQAEQIAELPGELLRKLQGSLLPSWERKTLVIANKHTPKAKNFAWDFGDNPKEVKLGETMGYAGTTSTISRDIKEGDKIRFILRLLAESENHRLCVFCNLKSMASELSARLTINGVAADYIAGNLNPDRKNQIVTKALTWSGARKAPEPAAGEGSGEEAPVEPAPRPAQAPGSVSRFPADSFVLVLTDDGAKGLSRPEFMTVVNYDLPLEPEFYFERLNFLKRQDPAARLYNLVCERYMYGLPAIQRMIDASLSVVPLEADAMLPEDLSAGQTIERPEPRFKGRGDRYGRDNRREGPERRSGPERRPEGRSNVASVPGAPARPNTASDVGVSGGASGAGDARGETRRPPLARGPRPAESSRGGTPDPYAMSMEERLALYKKKYGKQLEQSAPAGRSGSDPRRRGRSGQGPRTRETSQPRSQVNTAEKAPTPLAPPRANPSGDGLARERNEQGKPETGTQAPAEKAKGLFGKLQDFFGSHKE